MPFEWPSPDLMSYRIWRLRRLLMVAVLVPMSAILIAFVAGLMPLHPTAASVAIMVVAALAAGHIALFPNAAHETLALSGALTLLVLMLPRIGDLALLAPPDYAQAAMVVAALLALAATGAVMALLAKVLQLLIYAGPSFRWALVSQVDLACSPAVAHQQCALKPQIRRGRILTGQADARGLFDVAVASAQVADPVFPDQPLVARVTALVLQSDDTRHDVALMLPDGSVTVTAQRFAARAGGCRVTLSEMPGDFTFGMYLHYWLTDQQADGLTEMADTITGHMPRANGLAHGVSFASLASLVLSPTEPLADRAK